MRALVIFILVVWSFNSISQCNGTQSFTLTPPPSGGTYNPGQVVTMCYTMNGYTQAGLSLIHI